MSRAGETFRTDMAEGVPPIGMTRVGLHVGDAIVGNFGGEDRIQYTALGDSMNTASRLESANRSEEHTSELQSLMRISYAVFCLKKKNKNQHSKAQNIQTL